MEPVRLQKYIASCGVASRRAAEKLIEEGRVSVNGQIVTEQGVKVTPKDKVMLDGKPIKPEGKKVYIMLNKPEGYICAVSDDRERPCVVDMLLQLFHLAVYAGAGLGITDVVGLGIWLHEQTVVDTQPGIETKRAQRRQKYTVGIVVLGINMTGGKPAKPGDNDTIIVQQ